jgi:hypothetical protein
MFTAGVYTNSLTKARVLRDLSSYVNTCAHSSQEDTHDDEGAFQHRSSIQSHSFHQQHSTQYTTCSKVYWVRVVSSRTFPHKNKEGRKDVSGWDIIYSGHTTATPKNTGRYIYNLRWSWQSTHIYRGHLVRGAYIVLSSDVYIGTLDPAGWRPSLRMNAPVGLLNSFDHQQHGSSTFFDLTITWNELYITKISTTTKSLISESPFLMKRYYGHFSLEVMTNQWRLTLNSTGFPDQKMILFIYLFIYIMFTFSTLGMIHSLWNPKIYDKYLKKLII